MESLNVNLKNDRRVYFPGEELAGEASWELGERPKAVEVRLFWYTRGKGTRDVQVVDRERFDFPPAVSKREFRFTLPDSPYSFSGKLISLVWAVEVVCEGAGGQSQGVDIVVAPEGREIDLCASAEEGGA